MILSPLIYNLSLYFLGIIVILSAFSLIYSKNLFESIIISSILSAEIAVIYSLFDAPDVALTECAVNASISTIILIAASIKMREKNCDIDKKPYEWLMIIIIFVIMSYMCLNFEIFGGIENNVHNYIAKYYIENTYKDIGIKSTVTAILASYRGFDTLGETLVIFTAGLSVFLILKTEAK